MPFTPFHFGPGLLVKAVAPRAFSWTAFLATQVVIDCETLFYMARNQYPVHREMHTLIGATAAGLGTAAGMMLFRGLWPEFKGASLKAESSAFGLVVGGIVGGASHPLLDALMHPDIQPFLPWIQGNPLLDKVGLGELHLACAAAGLVGLALLGLRLYREARHSSTRHGR